MSKKVLIAMPSSDFDPANTRHGIQLLEEKGCTDGHTVHIYDFEFEFIK